MDRDAVGRFLLQQFTFLGVDFQVWMPLVVAGLVAWFVYLWLTREWP